MKQLIKHILCEDYREISEYKKWTEDEIRQVAKKYQKPSDFKNNDKAAYSAANRKGKEFFNDITSHMDKSYYTFWTDEMLRELAKKFKTKSEFQNAESSAYNSALRKGMDFLNDITSHMDKKKKDRWSDEDLEKEAKKYQNRGDFQKYSNSAYIVSRNRGKDFFDKITNHMVNQLNYWTEDDLRVEATKYKTKKEFRLKNPQAYSASLRNGEDFHNEITSHMEVSQKDWTDENLRKEVSKYDNLADFTKFSESAYQILKKKGKKYFEEVTKNLNRTISWTDEMIKDEALKYKTRGEFQKGSNVAYQLAKSRKILDDVCSHMERAGSKYKRLIYSYEFPDNSVYVGLTYNLNKRDLSHMRSETSSVYQHMIKTGLKPIRKTLTEFLDKDEASEVEGKLTEKYRQEGWNVLNRAKTGVLGGSTLYWTPERIRDEAKKYNTLSDFYEKSPSAISAAKKIGKEFYDEITSHIIRKQTKLSEKDLMTIAKKYNNKMTFFKDAPNAYAQSKRKGEDFFNKVTSHMKSQKTYWTDEMLKDESSKYSSRNGFAKGSPSAYTTARKRGLLDLFFPSVTK
jgi:hypothetical protein